MNRDDLRMLARRMADKRDGRWLTGHDPEAAWLYLVTPELVLELLDALDARDVMLDDLARRSFAASHDRAELQARARVASA